MLKLVKPKKQKYWVLSLDNGKFYLMEIKAKDDDEVVDILSEIRTNYANDILMNKAEFKDLLKVLRVEIKKRKSKGVSKK